MKILYAALLMLMLLLVSVMVAARKAPDFSLMTSSGQTISLADYRGKPLVLHFWATWCPYCKKLQPGLDRLYLTYHSQGLEMLAVSIWEEQGADPQASFEQRALHFTTVINGDDVAASYGVPGTPTTVFITKTGDIIAVTGTADPNNAELEQAITLLLQ